jgi:hypothetical protein
MISGFIVVTYSSEIKTANLCASLIILALKVAPMTDMTDIGMQIIADASDQ